MDNERRAARLQLRSSTSEMHQRVDALGGRVANVSDPDGYRVFLRTMTRVISRYGARLDDSSERAGIAPRSQRIRAALAADLEALKAPTPQATLSSATCVEGEQWGVGYALEGSALGAAVLLDEVKESAADLPVNYFSLLVDERPGRWAAFGSALGLIESESTLHAATKAANEVFGLVEASFLEFSNALSDERSVNNGV